MYIAYFLCIRVTESVSTPSGCFANNGFAVGPAVEPKRALRTSTSPKAAADDGLGAQPLAPAPGLVALKMPLRQHQFRVKLNPDPAKSKSSGIPGVTVSES